MLLAPTLDAIPAVRSGKSGRPRQHPVKRHADNAYDPRHCRQECRARGIQPGIARRGVDSMLLTDYAMPKMDGGEGGVFSLLRKPVGANLLAERIRVLLEEAEPKP